MSAAEVSTPKLVQTDQTETARRARLWRNVLLVSVAVIAIYMLTYFSAWFDAYNLTMTYMDDADTSFAAGNYMDALSGYEEYNKEVGENIFYGGYSQVVTIWSSHYALPAPDCIGTAKARIDAIIDEHMTIEDAEEFVQINIGRTNAYLGRIYLRLGELYEEEGDRDIAEDIYEEVVEYFPNESDLVDQASQHLENLSTGDS